MEFLNGFVSDVKMFSGRSSAPSYGNVLNAVRSHLNYLVNHDVVDASFEKKDIKRIVADLKQYQTRWDARVGGKFFMSLPNDFPLEHIRDFLASVLPEPIDFEYVVHKSKRDGKENLHVHVFFHPINKETKKKLQWKRGVLSQLHKNYKDTLEKYGYELVTHKEKGEEPSIHVGQRMYYMPEAKEYIENARAIGTLEKVISAAQKETRKKELETLKKIDPEILLSHLGIPYKKQGNAYVFSAPYRTDTNPSCRIEPSRYGDWHFVDFGAGQQGGTYIDLLLAYGYTYKQSIDLLRKVRKTLDKAEAGQRSLTLATPSASAPPKERLGEKEVNLRVEPIQQHPETLNYILKTRGYKTVPDFVKWISDGKHVGYGTIDLNGDAHIRFVGKSDIKEYCTGSSTVTLIKGKDSSQVVVTEGIHDAISLVNYGLTSDIIILNGVGNINKALPLIQQYHKVYACTDNDRVGQETAKTLIQACLKQKIPVYKIVFKSKDIDEAWRNQELLHVTQINPDKYWER